MSLTDLTIDEKKDLYYDLVEGDSIPWGFSQAELDYLKELVVTDIDAEEKRS